MNQYDDDAALLFDAVREAGALAVELARKGFSRWRKPDGTPVTDADIAVDRLLKERLATARPEYGWLSEETPDDSARLLRQRLWVADPIDGTRTFAGGGDGWCIAVALIDGERPVLGAIYCPLRDEFYHAVADEGAYLNGAPLARLPDRAIEGARVIGNSSALKAIGRTAKVDTVGGTDAPLAMRLAGVAAQRFDAALSTTPKHDWDLAAGDLIVHETGGVVTGLDGQNLAFNRPTPSQRGYVASGPRLHGSLLKILGEP